MTIDLFTGETGPESVILDEALVARREATATTLEDGEICFVDLEALWVHPQTNELYIDGEYSVYPVEETDTYGAHMLGIARLMRYKGLLVVDVSHIAECMQEMTGGIEDFKLCTVDSTRAEKFAGESLVINGALIMSEVELGMFADLWKDEYGDAASPFGIIVVPVD